MPKGPKGERRPADVVGAAIMVGRIATGDIEDAPPEDGKNAAAVALGHIGGKARASKISAKKRKEIAKKASAMAAGLASSPMEMRDLVAMIDAANPVPAKRGAYKKQAA